MIARRAGNRRRRESGFTLVEVLAALAITSVIIVAVAGLFWNVSLFFDRGTRGVSEADRLVLAVDRLAADFSAARFAQRQGQSGRLTAAFIGQSDKSAQSAKALFISGNVVSTSPRTEEIVVLTVEHSEEITRLVRRRAPWLGPRTQLDGIEGNDPVVLIEGHIDIQFAFGKITPDGVRTWQDSWFDEFTLPRFVKLTVRNRETGAELLLDTDFAVRSNAPPSCVADAPSASCLVASAQSTGGDQSQPAATNQTPAAANAGH